MILMLCWDPGKWFMILLPEILYIRGSRILRRLPAERPDREAMQREERNWDQGPAADQDQEREPAREQAADQAMGILRGRNTEQAADQERYLLAASISGQATGRKWKRA